jgi:phytoene/squalene synthetase
MPFWNAKRSEKDTDALVQRIAQEWKIGADAARTYVEGRGAYLRLKDVKKPDELRQYQRSVAPGAGQPLVPTTAPIRTAEVERP